MSIFRVTSSTEDPEGSQGLDLGVRDRDAIDPLPAGDLVTLGTVDLGSSPAEMELGVGTGVITVGTGVIAGVVTGVGVGGHRRTHTTVNMVPLEEFD